MSCLDVYLSLHVEFLVHVFIQVDLSGLVYNWIMFTAVFKMCIVAVARLSKQ